MDTQIGISYLFLFFYFTNIQFPLLNLSDFYTLNILSPTYTIIAKHTQRSNIIDIQKFNSVRRMHIKGKTLKISEFPIIRDRC